MAKDWDSGNCNEKSGFLFSHECFQSPVNKCNMCGKPVCQEHSHSDGAAVVCTSCAKKDHKRAQERGGRRRSRYHDDHDPYHYDHGYHDDGYYSGPTEELKRSLREELKADLKADLKAELKEELKAELIEELRQSMDDDPQEDSS